jgi:protein-S-isoprenylcysteine O-methyltransferase Ste14
VWTGVFVWLAWIIKPSGGRWLPRRLGPETVVAAIAIVAGILLGLTAVFAFAATGRGTPFPLDPPERLVAMGPYRHVRNPLYLAAGLILACELLLYSGTLEPGGRVLPACRLRF